MASLPKTQYAKSGDLHIAYQVTGQGPLDTAGDGFFAAFDGPARAIRCAAALSAGVAGLARSGEVLVSSTVKDLVAGSGLGFEDRGAHTLKGVPGQWHLYAVASAA